MKKENNNQKTEFSINKINRIISKINKSGLILIVVVYIVILSLALGMIGKDISYVTEPNYQHQYYDKEISPQLTIVGVRDFDDDHGHAHTKYSISVNIAGRHVDGKDPNYKINSFRMFANTKNQLDADKPNSTYYFTEHTTYSTPITHSFTVDSSDTGVHPSTFYVRLQYDNKNKPATFKEDVFLQPTANDIDGMDDWYNLNTEKSPSAANILAFKDQTKPVGVMEVQAYKETDEDGKSTGKYLGGIRLTIADEVKEDYHIDMQSWIVTKDGEYLPFIGVYNYTGPSKRFTNSGKEIDERLQPQYIAVKVVYSNNIRTEKDKETGEYVQVADQYVSYIKQDITKIKGTFSTNQEVGLDKDAGTTEQSNRGLYIGLIVGSVVALSVVVIACAYSYVEQQEKKKLKK